MADNQKILIIDDDMNTRRTLSDILASRGYGVVTAGSGKEGLALMDEGGISLALVDLRLPDMPGLDVIAEASKRRPLMQFIVITGHASMDSAIEAVNRGAFCYVVKPYEVEHLLLNVANALAKHADEEEIERLASFIRQNPNPAIELTAGGEIIYVNPAAEQFFPDLLSLGSRHPLLEDFDETVRLLKDSEDKHILREITLGGRSYDKHLSYFEQSELVRMYVVDSTERRQAADRLRKSEEKFRNLSESLNGVVYSADPKTFFVTYVNSAVSAVYGYSAEEWLGNPCLWKETIHPDDRERALTEICDAWEKGENTVLEYRIVRKDGSIRWVSDRVNWEKDAEGNIVSIIGIAYDITPQKEAEKELERQACYDSLTELLNRAFFVEALRRAMELGKRRADYMFAVIFLDLDRFKTINDSFGHVVGDHLLVEVARRLKTSLRLTDTIARLGGDEFAILIEDMRQKHDAIIVADRIQDMLSKPFLIDGQEVYTGASAGIAFSATGYERPEDLLRDADIAMYRAKAAGRGRYEVFNEAMHAHVVRAVRLEAALRKAVKNNDLAVSYQPIISLVSGKITAVEALMRWRHPELGQIAPAEFIPLAEETGLIVPMGEWILREACVQNRAWHEAGHQGLRVAVNISALQFRHGRLLGALEEMLASNSLCGRALELEITESSAIESVACNTSVLSDIASLGVRLSLDDFGTGYSSLSCLQSLPIDTLKLGQSFLIGVPGSGGAAELAKGIIAMAHLFGLNVVAEGVETNEQLEFLIKEKCDEAQGFLFSRPVPADEIMRLLDEDKCFLESGALPASP